MNSTAPLPASLARSNSFERRITDKITLPPVTAEEATGILRSELATIALDDAMIREVLQQSTISVRAWTKKTQRYISIGRVMAAIREIRSESLAASTDLEKENPT